MFFPWYEPSTTTERKSREEVSVIDKSSVCVKQPEHVRAHGHPSRQSPWRLLRSHAGSKVFQNVSFKVNTKYLKQQVAFQNVSFKATSDSFMVIQAETDSTRRNINYLNAP